MSQAACTVFVIDDDRAVLDSLTMLLSANGLQPRGFASGREFLNSFDPRARGCVITDLRMPGVDGIQLIREMVAMGCILPVIVITGHGEVDQAVEAMKAGARDFIEKPYDGQQILRAVRGCLEELDAAVDAHASRQLVQMRLKGLTPRERQVLDLLLRGASNKAIARGLEISPRTVEIYRANVMTKMRADSLSQLVRVTLAATAT
jgi:two-component system response regulator FixJ